jgi:molybdopterin/thiamine biosynthesis adenylyltransferase
LNASSRYSRQVIVDGFGPEGQQALTEGRVMIVGMGGLGNPAAQYLAAAGAGTIGIMDNDVVITSNFNRQVLFRPDDINRAKVNTVKERLSLFNPEIEILAFNQRLEQDSAHDVLAQFDIVLDCLDNLQDRLLLNQICLDIETPLVHGGAIRFYGQLTTIIPFKGPCLSCFSPGNSFFCDCSRVGVLGPVPGIIGVLQALEAIKYLSGAGEVLTGRLLVFDGLHGTFDEVRVARNPECRACGNGNKYSQH